LIIAITCLIAIAVIAFILGVKAKDLPAPDPESPFQHLDERKEAIYENLRDLQFEFRLGKLSEADYQITKKDLQKELANVLAEVDRLRAKLDGAPPPKPPARTAPAAAAAPATAAHASAARPAPAAQTNGFTCEACGAEFEKPLKFCGECGQPMKVAQ
jgi:hypothetical protein